LQTFVTPPSQSAAYDRLQLQFSRIGVLFVVMFGGLLVVLGAGLWFTLESTVGLVTPLILFVGGIVLICVGLIAYPRVTGVIDRVIVDAGGVRLVRSDQRVFEILWKTYSDNLLMVDDRAVPFDKKPEALRDVQLMISPIGIPVQGPISVEAARAIMTSAQLAGLQVKGWAEVRTSPGSESEVQILRSR
jgi:hypothetical protein